MNFGDYESNFNSAEYEHNKVERKNSTRRHRDNVYKQHLVFLADRVGNFPCGAYLKETFWDKTRKPRYARIYRGKRSKYIKQQCNREFRNKIDSREELPQHCEYKKCTEFWYEYI